MVFANGNLGVKLRMNPIRITAEAVTSVNVDVAFVAAVFLGEPKIGSIFEFRKFALNKVAIKLRFSLGAASSAACFVKAALKQKTVARLVHEKLPRSFAVVESFWNIWVGSGENDESDAITSIAGTAAVVIAVGGIEGMATDKSIAAFIVFRIRHGKEMRGVNRKEQFEVDFAGGKFVGELSEKALELTARRIIGDAEGITQGFKNATALFVRSIGVGSELFDSDAIIVGFVVRAREEADGVVDKNALFLVSVPFDGSKNLVGEILNEDVIRVVSLGAVDDDGLQVFVPGLRLAEKVAKFAFAFYGVVREAIDEVRGNVVENVGFVGMAAVIVDGSPKIVAGEFSKFIHDVYLQK